MNIVQLTEGAGKTISAVLQSIKNDYPIIVPNEIKKAAVLELYESLKTAKYISLPAFKKLPQIYTMSEVLQNKDLLKGAKGVVIDDFDVIVQEILGVPASCITVTTK